MNKKGKLILLISIAATLVAVGIALTLIFTYKPKTDASYNYPDVIPTISNPDEVYMTIGSREITNQEMYNMTIISYGLTTMIDMVDEEILSFDFSDEEYNDYLKELYASFNSIELDEVDLEDAQQKKTFIKQMNLQGYFDDADIERSIRLDLARQALALKQLDTDIANYVATEEQPIYFSNEAINTAISSISELSPEAEVIFLSFRSKTEALKLMRQVDISTTNLAVNWKSLTTNEEFSQDEVLNKFIEMYNLLHEETITLDSIPRYTQEELSKISSTISNMAFNTLNSLDEIGEDVTLKSCYVGNPNKTYITDYYYLVIKVKSFDKFDSTDFLDMYQNGLEGRSEEEKDFYNQVLDILKNNALTSTYINKTLYQERLNHNIKIYDERLDIAYFNQSSSALSNQSYQLTTDMSSDSICLIDDIKINVDDFNSLLMKRYGAVIAMQFMNFYMIFNDTYSTIYNFETKTKLDDYDASYESNIAALKTSLESGEYEAYGYNRNYGWENFLRDYGGITYLDDVIMLGDAYNLALVAYQKSHVTATNDTADELYDLFRRAFTSTVDPSTKVSIDYYLQEFNKVDDRSTLDTIVYQTLNQFNSFYSIKASYMSYFFDVDDDGIADEVDAETDALGERLFNALFYIVKNNLKFLPEKESMTEEYKLAKKFLDHLSDYSPYNISGETIEDRISKIITIYNISGIDDEVFWEFKKLGLRFGKSSQSTYTDSSSTEIVQQEFKAIWNKVLKGELLLNDGITYAYFEHSDKVNPQSTALSAVGISSDNLYILDNFVELNNRKLKYIISDITNTTWYHYYNVYNEASDTYNVSEELVPEDKDRLTALITYYSLSLIDSKDRTAYQQSVYEANTPMDFEAAFVTNILSTSFNAIISDDVTSVRMNDRRRAFVENEIALFTNSTSKDTCLLIINLLYN